MTVERHDNPLDRQLDSRLEAHFNAPAVQLTPSSGFVVSVMEAVQQEAAEPAPIAFPWRRVLPGAVAVGCTLIAFAVYMVVSRAYGSANDTVWLPASSLGPIGTTVGWAAAGLGMSVAAVMASLRVAGRRG